MRWFYPYRGMITADHQTLVGALTIFNTSLTHTGLLSDDVIRHATRFLAQGKIPTMMFGLPGAALAMYHCARPEHKERVKVLMLAGGLASFTTGIIELLEFCFIFVSPVLFIFHSALSGVAFMLMDMLHVMIGNVQGGAIDLVIFGVLGGARTQWWYPVLLGAVYCPLYYGVFRAVIRRRHVETPGRESDEQTPPEQEKLSADERSQTIINGLGGRQNIALLFYPAARAGTRYAAGSGSYIDANRGQRR